jgi:HTH-type transcriptional regulator / antitoxin HigA
MKSLKPIHTEDDYSEALATIEKYFDALAGTPEGDFIEILSVLVEDYERKHFPISLPDPIEAILYYLDTRGLDRKCLEPYIGGRGRVSEILTKKRPLSMGMIRKIHEGLGIPLEVLLQKYMDEPVLPANIIEIVEGKSLPNDANMLTPEWVIATSNPIRIPVRGKILRENTYSRNPVKTTFAA